MPSANSLIRWSNGFALLGLALAVAGCTESASPQVDLIDADLPESLRGGEQVAVDLDRTEPVELAPDRTIGEAADTTGLFLAEPTDVIALGDSVYIADIKHHAIMVADRQGRLVRQIGREGQAPGEFIEPALLAANDRYVFVYDHGNRRVQVFDHRFDYVRSIPHGFLWLSRTIVADDNRLFLPESITDSLMISVYDAEQSFQKKTALMPRLLPLGQQPLALNIALVTTDGTDACAVYIGLPYVFCFDDRLAHQRTFVFKGGPVETLNNPIPGRMEFSGGNTAAVMPFVMDFALRDDLLFLAHREPTVHIISMGTGQPVGRVLLPFDGYIERIHVEDERLLILMGGQTTVHVYDVDRILSHLDQYAKL